MSRITNHKNLRYPCKSHLASMQSFFQHCPAAPRKGGRSPAFTFSMVIVSRHEKHRLNVLLSGENLKVRAPARRRVIRFASINRSLLWILARIDIVHSSRQHFFSAFDWAANVVHIESTESKMLRIDFSAFHWNCSGRRVRAICMCNFTSVEG